MNLELSKQYPFNFAAVAFAYLGIPFDEQKLARLNAVELDAYLHERGASKQEAICYLLNDDGATPPPDNMKHTISLLIGEFDCQYRAGRFGLVSLSNYNNLAMSWIEIEEMLHEIKTMPDETRALRYLHEIHTRLHSSLISAKRAMREEEIGVDDNIKELSVRKLGIDSFARQILIEHHIETVGDLMFVTADYLTNLKGFGDKRIERLRECLQEIGVHLLGE